MPARPRIAPATRAARPSDRWSYPGDVRGLEGDEPAPGMRLVVPRSRVELEAWGARLGNCLADFATAVTQGRAWIVGVEVEGVLTYALELTPEREVRQFVGRGNRRPAEGHAHAVLDHLATTVERR